MSLELFAKLNRENMQEYEIRMSKPKVTEIVLEEPDAVENPFLQLTDIYKDAIPSVNSNKFFSISFLGSQGFGKSFAASILGTFAVQDNFTLIYGKAEDFMEDRESWVEEVRQRIKANGTIYNAFILDDMSYSNAEVSAKKSAGFKHFIADIRHVFEEKDEEGNITFSPKLFIIYISHRLHSLPPMLRTSGTWIFASMQSEDRSDAIKLIPKLKEERDRLDSMFRFLQKITIEGPKAAERNEPVKYMLKNKEFEFRWGDEKNPGDGRLMMVSHAGEMKILQVKNIPNIINLEKYRIKPKKIEIIEEVSTQPKTKEERIKDIARAIIKKGKNRK